MKILVSNNSELLRHLGGASFRTMPVEVMVATSGQQATDLARAEHPALCVLDAEMADMSGYQVAQQVKRADSACRVILVLGTRITSDQMKLVADSGCDEILIAPMEADQLYDVVALQLGLPRRGSERFDIDLLVVRQDGERKVEGRITNLSLDGARLVLQDEVAEGSMMRLAVRPHGGEPISIDARVVWAQRRGGATVLGAEFKDLSADARRQLARLTQWEIIHDTERMRVVIKGDITEATRFDGLLPALVGRVDFDASQVRYMNSLGVREWVELLRKAPIQGYEFHACSVPFILQACLVEAMLGRGTVTSFFAPYACEGCDHTSERLLQTAAILATQDREPPVFSCPHCDRHMVLDDVPERYLAFLPRDDDD